MDKLGLLGEPLWRVEMMEWRIPRKGVEVSGKLVPNPVMKVNWVREETRGKRRPHTKARPPYRAASPNQKPLECFKEQSNSICPAS